MILRGGMEKVEIKIGHEEVTGRMGLSWIAHSLRHFGLEEMVDRYSPRQSGSNREIAASRKVLAAALSIIAGAERLEDIEVLRQDRGLVESLGWGEIISPDTLREYLGQGRSGGQLRKINEALVVKALRESKEAEFTYDNDATYFNSGKASATYSYQKQRQYSGLVGYIAELGICATVDFRPGHKSPQEGILNQLRKALRQAKAAGKQIARFRSDSAAHKNEIFEYCEAEGIRYYISLDNDAGVRESVGSIKERQWQELPDNYGRRIEWAEGVHATNKGNAMRILVLRWLNPERELFEAQKYRYHVIGTNDAQIEALTWLEVHNGRMQSENIHKEIKDGFNGKYAPSHDFEMDRGYFIMNVLAYNMMQIMKLFYLGERARQWTVKRLRYWFIQVCGKILRTGRKYYCKIINATAETVELYRDCLARLRTAW